MTLRWASFATEESSPCSVTLSRRASLQLGLGAVLGFAGCRTHQQTASLPAKYRQQSDLLTVNSDVRLPPQHPLLVDLRKLRGEIARTLELPEQQQEVVIYLFGNEERYARYLQATYPDLPPRRAYFVGTSKELAVYTFWGEKIQEDLRHEYTHGVLHATLKDVPLWLDEGLAEYFEVTDGPTGMHRDYTVRLASALEEGWVPDMHRLEQLESVSQMQKTDYQESWGWVHFLLHHSPESRSALLGYLGDLRVTAKPGPLSTRVAAAVPNYDDRFKVYAASFTTSLQ